jgi:D-alanyl-D-alanine carboxypeptidase
MHGYALLPGSDAPVDVTSVNPSGIDAAGAVVSTPADLDVVFRALTSGELLDAAMLAEMRDAIDVGDGLRYGLGLAWAPSACGGYWTHFGDTLGYHTRNAVNDAGDRSVTIALTGDGEFEGPAAALVDRVLCED